MTKEEVLQKHLTYGDDSYLSNQRENILVAMEEYAKIKAIEFAKFVSDKGYYTQGNGETWYHVMATPKSSDQLYELFQKSSLK